ncbi:MAG: hypothetical protein H6684_15660 [Deltaproteobacteria bacterium]|nr:hypothetical protein [Deltaproteobacteria bacterium]MCB9490167.1 hypothetical protein [Deltaproteobacteria bacterium]
MKFSNLRLCTFILLLALALTGAMFACGGGDDDDERDSSSDDDDDVGPSGVSDDDDDSDDDDLPAFECGDDLNCYDELLICLRDCDNLSCLTGCDDAYNACLAPNGCAKPQLDCYDDCLDGHPDRDGPYWECVENCDTTAAGCWADECGSDEECLGVCGDTARDCRAACGAFDFACLIGCTTDIYACTWDC